MSDIHTEFARKSAEFTIEILEQLKTGNMENNIVISPFSIQCCMALVYAGAKGQTANEIASAMRYIADCPQQVAETFQHVLEQYRDSDLLKIANKVYVPENSKISSEYAAVTTEKYQANAEAINFAESQKTANKINQWVEEKTCGKITNLLSPLSVNALTRLLLLNAVYFKAEWQTKFAPPKTFDDDFWASGKNIVRVKYMIQKHAFPYHNFTELNFAALEMPYKDCDLSMLVLLPTERIGLPDLLNKLKDINPLDLAAKLVCCKVKIELPKFKISFGKSLNEVLKEMGVKEAFSNQADLSNILDSNEHLSVTQVMHKACIEVNEAGTEAAAVTIACSKFRTAIPVPSFEAKHPFLYWIWNRKTILFAGAIVDPSMEN